MKTLIKSAIIIDGTGEASFAGDVLFDQSQILAVSSSLENGDADTIVDAEGRYLAPGFIDLHSHSDLAALDSSLLKPKMAQGITTEVCGVCGLGVAPMPFHLQEKFRQQSIIGKGKDVWPWQTFSQFKHHLALQSLDQSIFPFVGHGVLRYAVAQNRPDKLSGDELNKMQELLQQCFDQGAKGLSLGLIYLPALYADTDELRAVIEIAAKNRKMVMVHLRSESDGIIEAIEEVAQLCFELGAKLHLSHLKIIGQQNEFKIDRVFELIEQYNLTFDHYPYCYGSTTLFSLIPPWMIDGDTPSLILKKLLCKRDELIKVFTGQGTAVDVAKWGWDNLPYLCGWDNIFVSCLKDNRQGEEVGKSVAQLARIWNCDEVDAFLKILLQEDGQVMMTDTYMREELLKKIMQHPRGHFATDSLFNANPHPRVSDAYPKILREYVFQKKWLTVEEAVAKMTGYSAKLLGMDDRGVLAKTKRPELVLFDANCSNLEVYISGTRFRKN